MAAPVISRLETTLVSMYQKLRMSMRPRCAATLAVLVLAPLPPAIAQPPCHRIHVEIRDLKNSNGSVACALFESPEGFPADYLRQATNIMSLKVRDHLARCDFEAIPPGTYALAVIHDENMNGKLDSNMLGVPTEGYGFSNDAMGLWGPPSFQAASFVYDGVSLDLTIRLHY